MDTQPTTGSHRYRAVLLAFIISISLWTLVRLGLLIYSWNEAAPSILEIIKIFSVGFLFDLCFFSFATILPCLYITFAPKLIWHSKPNKYVMYGAFFLTIFIMIFGATAEFFFWDEFSVRFNFISVDYLIYRKEVVDNIIESYPVFIIIPALAVISGALTYYFRSLINSALEARNSFISNLIPFAGVILIATTGGLFLTSGLRDFSDNTYQKELAANGPYQFVSAFKNNELDFYQFYPSIDEETSTSLIRNDLSNTTNHFVSENKHSIFRSIKDAEKEKQYNVILVTIESLTPNYLSRYGMKEDITPNLNALVSKAQFYTQLYATGTRTTRGLEALALSIPPTPGRSIVKRIGNEKGYLSLGRIFKSKGYDSYYIYGGRGYFDNMNEFFSGNGYTIVDQSSVPKEEIGFENAWGMADEYLYDQVIKTADKSVSANTPFFLHVMTTSNHRPYTYPDNRVSIPSGYGRSGAVQYSDWAIGDFLKKAQKKTWFDNTIFIFVADHQASSAGRENLPVRRYRIPMWIYAPKIIEPKLVDTLASQIDVAPTILGLLNWSYPSFFYGKDIARMAPDEGRAFIGNYQFLGLFDGKRMAILGPKKSIEVQTIKDETAISSVKGSIKDPLVQKAISYYQNAAWVYKNKLNNDSLLKTIDN
ncbi:LTA synthase family protein [Halodesulfovibrio marinisediminis]|uniref:Phosphoglycerol transferase MdoB n=1 Tax=Halodesulfovibrio marinisediminis DSM 17456 TaxID=1121457 RepID=A0A1N6H7W7_9BACT|nr:alkaline phosphatase family protein [Halodesulfovibrio marinisediminis]SIO15856.1 Phosphoglycerol transferase MdoB [Halodesulfovibrio marinisediminis DSM 17456]